MVVNYQIGAFSVQVDSEFTITESERAELFRSDRPGNLRCVCRVVDRVREDFPSVLHREDGLTVFETSGGREMVRYTSFPQPHAYQGITESDRVREITLSYAAGDLSWASEIGYLWRAISLRHCLLRCGNLLMHSSYVGTRSGAILFAGDDEIGGATQAELWAKKRDAVIVNGGRAVVGTEDGLPMVYGLPLSGKSRICKNQTMPLRAVVVLQRSREGRAVRLSGPRAMAAVSRYVSKDVWRAGENALSLSIQEEILSPVPVYLLDVRGNETDLLALEEAMGT